LLITFPAPLIVIGSRECLLKSCPILQTIGNHNGNGEEIPIFHGPRACKNDPVKRAFCPRPINI